jgi:hypothetical protein
VTTARKKGTDFQRWVRDWIQERYPDAAIHNQPLASKMIMSKGRKIWVSQRNDIFGAIDLIVIMPGRKPLFIQATMYGNIKKRLEELRVVPWPYEYVDVELWVKNEKGVINIKRLVVDPIGLEPILVDYAKIERRKFYLLRNETPDNDETGPQDHIGF